MSRTLLLLPLLFVTAAYSQATPQPTLDGYVSAFVSSSNFVVDDIHVAVDEKSQSGCATGDGYAGQGPVPPLSLGDHLWIYGKLDHKANLIHAQYVCRQPWQRSKVSGAAVLEKVNGDRIHVDGRVLLVTQKSAVKADPPRHGLVDAQAGDWVRYAATAQQDGTFVLDELTLTPNTVSEREQKLRAATPREFVTPDPATRRDGSLKFSRLGRNRYKLPADPVVLNRLKQIGDSLVPGYQRALPSTDPAYIDFRFYSIERLKLKDCLSMPSGIILVPVQVTNRLTDDDELAAVLATCVAGLIEKQALYLVPREEVNLSAESVGLAVGLAVPGVGPAAWIASSVYSEHLTERLREQSDRVGLELMAATGRPPRIAPHAYAILESKSAAPKLRLDPSAHVQYLYQAVAERERATAARPH